jgi:hypothetical protein
MMLSKDKKMIDELKKRSAVEYKLTNLGEAHWILGMEIIRDRNKCTITLSQCRYIKSILKHFEMASSHPVAMPMDPNMKLVKVNEAKVDVKTYQSPLGALIYTMLATRPDIMFAATPGQMHWTALKHVYWYLCGTVNKCLIYQGDPDTDLHAFVNADWATGVQ